MKQEAILIFDIGKTNKKALLFDKSFNILSEIEIHFNEIADDDGYPCDDIGRIENWIDEIIQKHINNKVYRIKALNFATYGATLMHIDKNGRRITPLYNYLKPIPGSVIDTLCRSYGGPDEFGRKTGSEVLGMLNSGIQIYWLKQCKNDIYSGIEHTLHFPQYLSYILTGEIGSEYTSIGCHTALWDFDKMEYHEWLAGEGIVLPHPAPVNKVFPAIKNPEINVGIGIHDSSASLVPFLEYSKENFILVSTGTWCVCMNPFNYTPLTIEQLEKGCLCHISIKEKPVKSSRFYLGHIHDVNTKMLVKHYKVNTDEYRKLNPSESVIKKLHKKFNAKRIFFKDGIPEEYVDDKINLSLFNDFEEAYNQLIIDLVQFTGQAIRLILNNDSGIKFIYLTGGFSRNTIFTKVLAAAFKDLKVYTSDIYNATSLGAALVIKEQFTGESRAGFDLNIEEVKPFTYI